MATRSPTNISEPKKLCVSLVNLKKSSQSNHWSDFVLLSWLISFLLFLLLVLVLILFVSLSPMVIPFLFFLSFPLLLLSFPHCMLVFCRPYQSCEIITPRQRLSTLPGISAATRRPSRIPILRWASSRTETTTREEVVCVITLPGAQASVSILGTVSRPPPSRLPRPPLHGSQNLL